jgi:hypothetical protein
VIALHFYTKITLNSYYNVTSFPFPTERNMIFIDVNVATGVLPIDPIHAVDAHNNLAVSMNDAQLVGDTNDYPTDPNPVLAGNSIWVRGLVTIL